MRVDHEGGTRRRGDIGGTDSDMRPTIPFFLLALGCPVETKYIGEDGEQPDGSDSGGAQECTEGPCLRWFHELQHRVFTSLNVDGSGRLAFATQDTAVGLVLDTYDVAADAELLQPLPWVEGAEFHLDDLVLDPVAGARALTHVQLSSVVQRPEGFGGPAWSTPFEPPISLSRLGVGPDGISAALGYTQVGEQAAGYVAALDADGGLAWEWQTEPGTPTIDVGVSLVGFDGDAVIVHVLRTREQGEPIVGTDVFVRLVDGEIVGTLDVGLAFPEPTPSLPQRIDGGWLLVGTPSDGGGVVLAVLDDDGTARWREQDDSTDARPLAIAVTASAILVVAGTHDAGPMELRSYELDGSLRGTAPFLGDPDAHTYDAVALPDGTVAVLGNTWDGDVLHDWIAGVLP
jgi:hypothetical protein